MNHIKKFNEGWKDTLMGAVLFLASCSNIDISKNGKPIDNKVFANKIVYGTVVSTDDTIGSTTLDIMQSRWMIKDSSGNAFSFYEAPRYMRDQFSIGDKVKISFDEDGNAEVRDNH